MIKHPASHVDHNLSPAQLDYLLDRFATRDTFFLETIELPPELGTVPCALWGPTMGDPPVPEEEVLHARRGARSWPSRLTTRPPRPTRLVTVIAGPHEEPCTPCDECVGGRRTYACVLYTAFGGPSAPQEPGDPGCKDLAASSAFWNAHALAR